MSTLVNDSPVKSQDVAAEYWKNGFVILRNVFDPSEMQELLAEADRLLTERADLIDPNNLRCRFMAHHETGEQLFEVFDPINDVSPICKKFCFDQRILSVLEQIYGEPACLFKEKLIFKPPGALGYQLHQDIPLYWKGFPRTFLTVLIPIDPSSQENGCTEVYSDYHHDFLCKDPSVYMLPADSVDASRRTSLILDPGDIAIFHGLTPHRSDPNRSSQKRRVFYISYNALSDGGDQHDAHYAEFHERMREYRQSTVTGDVYYA